MAGLKYYVMNVFMVIKTMTEILNALERTRTYNIHYCPKCYSEEYESISNRGRGRKLGYNYFKCKKCKTIFKIMWRDIPTMKDLRRYPRATNSLKNKKNKFTLI